MSKFNKRKLIKIISCLIVFSVFLVSFSSISFAAGDDSGSKPNILIKILAGALKWVSLFIHDLLGDGGIGIDNLVYGQGDGPFTGLTLFKPGPTQDFLALFYNIFNYIGMALFIPIALWAGMSISKGGDNPQAKSLMKDRLTKIILTMAFLYTMPQLLTLLIKISNAFVDIFMHMGEVDGVTGELVKNYVQLADDYTIVDAITSLVLVGINIWMISFYVIRDLTICFLFMLFPIIAIWHPFSNNMVKGWWVNMMGNVLAQPIQAVVLTMILSLGKTLPTNNFATGIYVLVAFGSVVPMTSIIKGFLGLETGIGAGSSRAGMGGAMGAMMLARGIYDTVKNNTVKGIDGIKEGVGQRMENSIAGQETDKNMAYSSSTSDELNRPLLNPNAATSSSIGDPSTDEGKARIKEGLKRSDRAANKKMISTVGSAVAGTAFSLGSSTFLGIAGAAIGAGAGGGWDSNAAKTLGVASGTLGVMIGNDTGSLVGKGASEAYDFQQGYKTNKAMESEIQELQKDFAFNEMTDPNSAHFNSAYVDRGGTSQFIDPKSHLYNEELAQSTRLQAENKYLGIDGTKLDGTEWQSSERQALMNSKKIDNLNTNTVFNQLSRKKYAELTPSRKTSQELMQIDNANLYQDNEKSVVYRPQEDGGYEVLSVGAGNPSLSQPIENAVTFQPEQRGIPNDVLFSINSNASNEAHEYMETAYPEITDTSSPEYIKLFNEKSNEYKRDMKHNYEDSLNTIRANHGIPNMSIKTNETNLEELMTAQRDKENQRQLELQQRKVEETKKSYSNRTYESYSRQSLERANKVEELF